MKFQGQLLPSPGLLHRPLLQLLLLLQQLTHLLVVAEGLPHQLSLGHPGMFKLRGKRDGVTRAAGFRRQVFVSNHQAFSIFQSEMFDLKEDIHCKHLFHVTKIVISDSGGAEKYSCSHLSHMTWEKKGS